MTMLRSSPAGRYATRTIQVADGQIVSGIDPGREAGEGGDLRTVAGRYLPRLIISAAALVLIVVKLVRPGARIDAVALGLLALAAIPWLQRLFKARRW